MASSNIKLFDENKGNMLSDSEFSISNQRLNGLQTGVASSQLQNKAMYQASLVAYAIAQVMMQNGKNANDTDAVSAFVANLSGTMLQKVYDIATTAEAQAGVATGKWMSPALVKAAIDTLAAKSQNILANSTKTFLGLTVDAVPNDVFLLLAKWVLIDKIDNVNGYSGTWIAPDVFGDGKPYKLAAYLIGAGGSGGYVYIGTSDSYQYYQATGGASGFGKNSVIGIVNVGDTFDFTIGKGGAPASYSSTKSVTYGGYGTGNNGGDTTFGSITAKGGSKGFGDYGSGSQYDDIDNFFAPGGQTPTAALTTSGKSRLSFSRPFGCVAGLGGACPPQSVRDGQNQFDLTMVSLCAGGTANGTIVQAIEAMPDGTKGGNAAYAAGVSVTAESATGYGNGGGGVVVKATAAVTGKSGAGSDGVIYLYASR